MNKDFNIEDFLSLEGYNKQFNREARRKDSRGTQEFFTPYILVKKIADKISDDVWSDSEKTFLEPSFGNFQFGCYIIYRRLISGIDWETTLKTLYGVELMPDNVKESKERVLKLFDMMGIEYDRKKALRIMNKNLVCSDFFKWDFENWKPIEEPKSNKLF